MGRRSGSTRWYRALLQMVVFGVVTAAIASTGVTSAGALAAAPVSYVSSTIPRSAVGAQFRWLLSAARNQPIAVPAIEAHFSRGFLAEVTPAQLNSALAEGADASHAKFDGVISATPGNLEAAVQLGRRGPRLVISMGVDDTGQISELNFSWITLRSRAALGMAPVSLPTPTGKAVLATETIVVSDNTRPGRDIPVQLWYPTTAKSSSTDARYAPVATALFLAQQLAVPARDIRAVTTHATESAPVQSGAGRLPVVLLSPGSGLTRTLYSGLSAELASHGYLVAVLDHPGDGQLVEYPDGHTIPAQDTPQETRLADRVTDARAVLDRLHILNADATSRLHDSINLDQVAFVGHSLGGATAAEAMRADDRIDAGVNLDGTLYGDVVQTGVDRPFLLVSSDRPEDETWKTFRNSSPEAQSLVLSGTGHMSYTDWPALSLFRPSNEPRDSFDIGTIDPGRGFTVQSAYVLAFLDAHLLGEPQPLLNGSPPQFAEAKFR